MTRQPTIIGQCKRWLAALAIGLLASASATHAACNLDIDGNGTPDAATDGLLLIRHLLGFTGNALTQGALGTGATRDAGQIQAFINSQNYDFDGNGKRSAATDGALAVRYLAGLTGAALSSGAIAAGAKRQSGADVISFIQAGCTSTVVTPDGGSASSAGAVITVPADSVMPASVLINIAPTAVATGTAMTLEGAGTAVARSADFALTKDTVLDFNKTLTVAIPYDSAGLSAAARIGVAYYDDALSKWIPVTEAVDNRANARVTFATAHFTTWRAFEWVLTGPPTTIDFGFDPAVDSIPMTNFGAAITPDGSTAFIDGSCIGMSGLAGWYFKYRKASDGTAATRFGDNSPTRALVAVLQSAFGKQFDTSGARTVDLPGRSAAIKSKLYELNSPLIANLGLASGAAHAVLIYKFDAGTFYYYDPNFPGVAQTFTENAAGQLIGWKALGEDVFNFKLFSGLGELISNADILARYNEFKNGTLPSREGVISNIATALQTVNGFAALQISGQVSTHPDIVGRPLYVHLLGPRVAFRAPTVATQENLTIQTNEGPAGQSGALVTASVTVAAAPFLVSVRMGAFNTGTWPVQIYISQSATNPFFGVWARTDTTLTKVSADTQATGRLNDTGITDCLDPVRGVRVACASTNALYVAQDGMFGRDFNATSNSNADGAVGFSFTKISNGGNELPATAVLGSGLTDWACTLDNVTGLMWEVKNAAGMRNASHRYSWYSSDSSNNGGSVGISSSGTCATSGRCDTEKFVQDVNLGGLCGHSDWRMPIVTELSGIVHFELGAAVDPVYFPNTAFPNYAYWTASALAGDSSRAWLIVFNLVQFVTDVRDTGHSVRLVRSGQ